MIHELRIYTAVPGKLPAVIARFRDHTDGLFAKHGFKPVGYWTNLIGPSNQQLIYILEWRDMAQMETCWAAFKADPEWLTVKTESEKGGPIVENVASSIMQPTDFSLIK